MSMRMILSTLVSLAWWVFVELPPLIVGLLACVLVVAFRSHQVSPINGNIITNGPRWLWLWGNDEDGMKSDEAKRHYFSWAPDWFNMYWWLAIRNPAGNQRFVISLYPPPVAPLIRYIIGKNYALTWRGWRHHLAVMSSTKVYTLGWKYHPNDTRSTKDYGWRKFGCGFAFRIRDRDSSDTLESI